MFDSHCHLTDIDSPEDVIAAARRSQVALLCCGYHADSNRRVLGLRRAIPELPIALGLHPWFAAEALQPVLDLIGTQRPTVVGEVGLDFRDRLDPGAAELQHRVLDAQLSLARSLGLAVTLHCRRAGQALLGVVKRHPGLQGVLHAYSGSFEELKPFLSLGYYLGVGGAVTRPRARRVRECAVRAPLDRIVLETDAPAIGMDGLEPPSVRPEHVMRVAESLAELRHLDVAEIAERTDRNAEALFGADVTLALDWVGARANR